MSESTYARTKRLLPAVTVTAEGQCPKYLYINTVLEDKLTLTKYFFDEQHYSSHYVALTI